MNPNDIHYLANEADRGGNIGDVLQVFVHDFTLRQGSGEAKVREVERKIGGVTGELFILHKLFQDFQTRVNEDHDLIMRLQHEIEALHNRVKSLDAKHTTTATQNERLDIRIEQLREQLNRTCDDTQQNVGRLLGNFARVHTTGGYTRLHNTTSAKRDSVSCDPSPKMVKDNVISDIASERSSLETREPSCNDADSLQSSIIPPTTFQPTARDVSNEELPANDEYCSVDSSHAATQPRSHCNESTSEDGGLQQQTSTAADSSSVEVFENNILEDENHHTFLDDRSSCNDSNTSDSNNSKNSIDSISEPLASNSQSISACLVANAISSDTVNHQLNSEGPLCMDNIPKDVTEQTFLKFSEEKDIITEDICHSLPDVDTLCTNSNNSDSNNTNNSIDSSNEPIASNSQSISACSVADVDEVKDVITKDTFNIKVLPQTSESTISNKSQTTTNKKNKSKRSSRVRRRKDAENQVTSEVAVKQASTQVNDKQMSSKTSKDQSTSAKPVSSENMEEQQHNFISEVMSPQDTDEQSWQSTDDQKAEKEQATFQLVEQQLTNPQNEEQASKELILDQTSSQQSEDQKTLQETEAQSLMLNTEEQQIVQHTEEISLQCIEEKETSHSGREENLSSEHQETHSKHPENQKSFERMEEQVALKTPEKEEESSSPKSKRRVTFHVEIDDDEIPDLSDVEEATGEEIQQVDNNGNGGEEIKPLTQTNSGDERTKIKQQLAEKSVELHAPCPRGETRRMESGEADQKDEIVGMCANCGFLATLRCGNCRQAFYCKRECQRDHWKTTHKDQCRPYQVLESPELGRYMVASRDLKAGDVILKDEPLVIGPKQITEPICLGCYKRVDGSYRCQKCHWPLCGPQCEKSSDHHPECVVGLEIGSPIEISNFDEPNHFYEVVFPLRCLALKKKSPKKYEQLMALDSHYDDRKGTHVFSENQKSIVNVLRNYFLLQQFPIEDIDSSEKSIHKITGIIDVNALELRLADSEVLGLYPNFAMMEHSCTPNTKHTFSDNRQVILKAAVDIKRGEHLSTMYTHILWGTSARRDHLKHSKYFMCTCFRCSDPTELGTNFSTLRCSRCTSGFMLSAAPLDELADWICTTCNGTVKHEEVTDINLKLGEEVEKVLAAPTVPVLEELVQKHAKTTVHPNHFHLFATRHTLLQMYGRDPSYASEDYMKKKERMCQDFLKVCTALDPGMSRLAPYAGVALYEYHLAVLSRTRQDPDARQTDPAALKKDVETAKALLQQCIRVLQDEPKDQMEGQLCHVAQQNLIELKQWEANLFSP